MVGSGEKGSSRSPAASADVFARLIINTRQKANSKANDECESARTMATMATGSKISNKHWRRKRGGFIKTALRTFVNRGAKTTPGWGEIKATATAITKIFYAYYYAKPVKAKLITKLTLCQTRNNEPKARRTRDLDEGLGHTFSESRRASCGSQSQLLHLNCQHPDGSRLWSKSKRYRRCLVPTPCLCL